MCIYILSLVRELQQDVRELNQADLPEVDPEENSAEFMGILIKVHTWTLINIIVNLEFSHLNYVKSTLVFSAVISVLCSCVAKWSVCKVKCLYFPFSSGSGQVEENPWDHQSHNGAAGTGAETDRQEVHHSDSRPCLPERRKPGPGEPTKVK